MGTVWRVEDLKQNRIVAAKILRQSHSTSLLRFVREQSLRIHHPHVLAAALAPCNARTSTVNRRRNRLTAAGLGLMSSLPS